MQILLQPPWFSYELCSSDASHSKRKMQHLPNHPNFGVPGGKGRGNTTDPLHRNSERGHFKIYCFAHNGLFLPEREILANILTFVALDFAPVVYIRSQLEPCHRSHITQSAVWRSKGSRNAEMRSQARALIPTLTHFLTCKGHNIHSNPEGWWRRQGVLCAVRKH